MSSPTITELTTPRACPDTGADTCRRQKYGLGCSQSASVSQRQDCPKNVCRIQDYLWTISAKNKLTMHGGPKAKQWSGSGRAGELSLGSVRHNSANKEPTPAPAQINRQKCAIVLTHSVT